MNRPLGYSQNFLKSPNLVAKLLDNTSIGANDVVYEIGPGKGIITHALARRCLRVIGIEVDRRLYQQLQIKFKKTKNVSIVFADFLHYSLPGNKEYKIFSNIPFNTTADIIRKVTSLPNPPVDTYLIVQKEAALKFIGQPDSKETQYSLVLKPLFDLRIKFHLKKTDFSPSPNVDTVLLQIKKRESPLVHMDRMRQYRDFIIFGFHQWKPTLRESLIRIFTREQYQRLAKGLGFNQASKPADLNFNQWLGLFNYFQKSVSYEKQILINRAEQQLKSQQTKLKKIHRTSV